MQRELELMLEIQVTFWITRFKVYKISRWTADQGVAENIFNRTVLRATTYYFWFVILFKHCTAELIIHNFLHLTHYSRPASSGSPTPTKTNSQTAAFVQSLMPTFGCQSFALNCASTCPPTQTVSTYIRYFPLQISFICKWDVVLLCHYPAGEAPQSEHTLFVSLFF